MSRSASETFGKQCTSMFRGKDRDMDAECAAMPRCHRVTYHTLGGAAPTD
ncbi:hypothetical protein M878_32105 [Streptomyces roseochromogenus subsp. oscitans DS 12.976]|uniref:Uncharacterized protein n=1 Tax=Streptomyces roseochromogenus subsp. oscitans DS 12.976 TaxID=1352936 RepID=V6JWB4_STRRC|nr:hypothetical protein M878_32105 [Streptomyces roseochromogenus subsp. oscitans DS 12.976]